jgi:Fe-S-cluster-containing hydrogenase component 2
MSTITLIENGILKQHLIDPEICIRCNTCEATCPVDAITHDDNNYVVMADKCNGCMDCISPCPTGSIDNWRWCRQASPTAWPSSWAGRACPKSFAPMCWPPRRRPRMPAMCRI